MSTTEINDLIMTCNLLPSKDYNLRLLDICLALNERIDVLEDKVERLAYKANQVDAIARDRT